MNAARARQQYGVLVVDDDDSVVRLLTYVLEGLPIDLVTATSAEMALEHFGNPDCNTHLVIADYRMPGRDGVSLLQEVHKRNRLTALVLHAAVPPAEVPAGIAVLPKPSGPQEVRAFVADRLTVHSLHREMEARRAQAAAL